MVPALSPGPDVWWQWWAWEALSSAGRKCRRWGFQKLCQEGWAGIVGLLMEFCPALGQAGKGRNTGRSGSVTRTPPKLTLAVFTATEGAVFYI